MMFTYRINDGVRIVEIKAETRKEAIKKFCETTGMPLDFFNEHCSIKCLGRITNGR